MTTEHFTLQGARTAAITESTSRATIFIGAVSAGLVALGLIATATRIGTAFYAFGLILLSTLSFLGFVTLDRVLQSGIEELHYAERIARLRAYYFDFAPELTHYLASVPPSRRLAILGLRSGYWPAFRTTAGMIGMVTAVLTGSDAGLPYAGPMRGAGKPLRRHRRATFASPRRRWWAARVLMALMGFQPRHGMPVRCSDRYCQHFTRIHRRPGQACLASAMRSVCGGRYLPSVNAFMTGPPGFRSPPGE